MPTFSRRKKESILTLIQFGRFDAVTRRLKKVAKTEAKAEGKGKSSPRTIARDLEYVVNPEDGLLPIHWACKNGTRLPKRALKALIDANPQTVERLDSENSTPLHFLVYYGFSSMDALKLLVKAYPEAVTMRDQCGRTPVFHAVEHEDGQKLQVLELLLGSNMKAADMLTLPCGPLDDFPMSPIDSRGFKFKQQNYSFHEYDMYWNRPVNERCPLHMMWSMALAMNDDDGDDNDRSVMNMPRRRIIRRSNGLKMQKALLLLEFAYLNQVGGAVELRRAIWRRRMAKKMLFSKRMVNQFRARSEGDITNEDDQNGQVLFPFHNNRRSISPTRTAVAPIRGLEMRPTLTTTPAGTPQSSHGNRKTLRRAQTSDMDFMSRRRARTVDVAQSIRVANPILHTTRQSRVLTADILNLRHTKSEGQGRFEGNDRRRVSQRIGRRKGAKGALRRLSTAASEVRNRFRKDRSIESLAHEDESITSWRDGPLNASMMGFSNIGFSEEFSQYMNEDELDFDKDNIAGRRRKFKKKKFRPFRNKRKYKRGETVKFRIVHAVVLFHEYLPEEVLDFALQLKPEQLEQADECNGNLPLHIATSINANPDVVEKLIHSSKDATTLMNSHGQLPLHISLCARMNVTSCVIDENDAINIDTVHVLVKTYPAACAYIDPITGLFPFMLAAVNLTDNNSDECDDDELAQDQIDSLCRRMMKKSLCSSSRVIFENQSFRGSIHSPPESFLSMESSKADSTYTNTTVDSDLRSQYARDRLTIIYQLLLLHPECCDPSYVY